MANVLTIASYTIEDAAGVKAPHAEFWLIPDTLTVAAVDTFFITVGAAVDTLTDGKIVRVSVELRPDFSGAGYKSTPVAQSSVEKTGLFNFSQSASIYKAPLDIPAIAGHVLTAGGTIDLTNSDVLTFIGLQTGPAGGGETPASKYANALLALIDAVQTFRKHRRQLNRSTFEPG
jgi:hypothetical protein